MYFHLQHMLFIFHVNLSLSSPFLRISPLSLLYSYPLPSLFLPSPFPIPPLSLPYSSPLLLLPSFFPFASLPYPSIRSLPLTYLLPRFLPPAPPCSFLLVSQPLSPISLFPSVPLPSRFLTKLLAAKLGAGSEE